MDLDIEGYEINEEIGRGSIGVVYLANQTAMDREVAVKILNVLAEKNADKHLEEARTIAKLNHPHIVSAYDAGISDKHFYITMEYLSGGAFDDLLVTEGTIEERQAMIYLYQCASALEHAWEKGLIHCDLKPGNLMLNDKGEIKITDLGLARMSQEAEETGGKRVVRGTPHYISPEQVKTPDKLDCRTDIYSLGATFYSMLCGSQPFSGDSSKEIILARFKKKPEKLTCVSKEFADLIDRMMSVNPGDRPQTPTELKQEIIDLGFNPEEAGDITAAIQMAQNRTSKKTEARKPRRYHPPKKVDKKTAMYIWIGLGAFIIVMLTAIMISMVL